MGVFGRSRRGGRVWWRGRCRGLGRRFGEEGVRGGLWVGWTFCFCWCLMWWEEMAWGLLGDRGGCMWGSGRGLMCCGF